MKLSLEGHYRRAIHAAFVVGAVGANMVPPAVAADATQLQGVEVTGSRIRRVETETADPVQVVGRDQILATGAATLGALLQSVPSISGTPYNSQVNNGGGDGAATANLRGLGSKRTLILLDGIRLNSDDLNAIPANMIDRIEVLKEGASAVYGTDAIGGVINFITRKTFTGLEVLSTVGATEEGGGLTQDYELTWGTRSSTGSAVFGASYNRQDEIRADQRQVSAATVGLYQNKLSPNVWTSSRGPYGRFFPSTGFTGANTSSCGSVRLSPGKTGANGEADFQCFVSNRAAGYTDRFNYQPDNLALTPSKRYSLFGTAQQEVYGDIKWFGSGYFNTTRANSQLAGEPFDNTTVAGVFPPPKYPPLAISADNVYNPFGQDITSFAYRSPMRRVQTFTTDTYQVSSGFKGTLLDRFNWDATANYGLVNAAESDTGYLNFSRVYEQLGPSYMADPATGDAIYTDPGKTTLAKAYDAAAAGGVATCGTPGAPIVGCTPINLFGSYGNTVSALNAVTNSLTRFDELDLIANIAGDIATLPAGAVGLALGGQYRTLHYRYTPDALQEAFLLSEANSKPTAGSYNVREAYAETRVPLLKDLPGAKSLTLDLGVRYASFSSFGNNVAGKYAAEWRPTGDLLVRASYNDVYRAPTTTELYRGAVQTSPSYSEVCTGAADAIAHPVACANFTDTTPTNNTQTNGALIGNPKLQAEKGYATDFGVVFNPTFYRPLTIGVDYFTYSLKQAIDYVSAQTVLEACYADNNSAFCGTAPNGQPYITRAADGQLANLYLPQTNANRYMVQGLDISAKLDYNKLPYDLGRLSLGSDLTYLKKYNLTLLDPVSGAVVAKGELEGDFDSVYTGDSFPHLRALSFVKWNKGPITVTLQDRFIGNVQEEQIDGYEVLIRQNTDCAGTAYSGTQGGETAKAGSFTVACRRDVGSANYVDVAGTYAFKKYKTEFTVGINDLFADGAQQMYNAANAGAGNPLYDIRGRNFYGRLKIKF